MNEISRWDSTSTHCRYLGATASARAHRSVPGEALKAYPAARLLKMWTIKALAS
jgi:hypothetical protein